MNRRLTIGFAVLSVTALAGAARWDGGRREQIVVAPRSDAPQSSPAAVDDRERARAVEVALAYVRSSAVLVNRGPIGRAEVLRGLVSPGHLSAQLASVDRDVAAIESRLRSTDGRAVPVSTLRWAEFPLTAITDDRSPESVIVRVWSVALFGSTAIEGTRSAWRTFTLTVVPGEARWLVDDVRVDPGPAPVDNGSLVPSAFREFDAVISWPPAAPRLGGGT